MGPGGLSRERAGFEVRDVHPTHYGRICPIATPEGPNIGLVGHLASYARVNDFGFIEAPFFVVKHTVTKDIKDPKTGETVFKAGVEVSGVELGKLSVPADIIEVSVDNKITDEVRYLTAIQEEKTITASCIVPFDENGRFTVSKTSMRAFGKPTVDHVFKIDHLDVSSNEIISIATSLIPFLEHDDGQRALMGSNMQRQAIPCVKPQAPLVGTGIEARAAFDSGHLISADEDGEIVRADAQEIHLLSKKGNLYKYRSRK
jgi:DNA-directed RNA polymerase subunit beta